MNRVVALIVVVGLLIPTVALAYTFGGMERWRDGGHYYKADGSMKGFHEYYPTKAERQQEGIKFWALIGSVVFVVIICVWMFVEAKNLKIVFYYSWVDVAVAFAAVFLAIIASWKKEYEMSRYIFYLAVGITFVYNAVAVWWCNKGYVPIWKICILYSVRVMLSVMVPVVFVIALCSGTRKREGEADAEYMVRSVRQLAGITAVLGFLVYVVANMVNGPEVKDKRNPMPELV